VQCWNDLPACDEPLVDLPSLNSYLIKFTLGVSYLHTVWWL